MAEKKINAVFIHIPKTAGIYIQEALSLQILRYPHRARQQFKNAGQVTFGHMNYLNLAKNGTINRQFDETAFKFAFCRNPYDRVLSHYFYAQKRHPDIIDPGMSFIDFSHYIYSRGIRKTFRPQYTWIDGIKMDFIGRYENLKEDIKTVSARIGAKFKDIPKRNQTKHKPYQEYYCETSKANIDRFYAIDFEKFGYDKIL